MGLGSARLSSRDGQQDLQHPQEQGKSFKTIDAIDVAARYFVYKLYDATRRDRIQWVPLKGIDESQTTIERAVELGWAVVQRRSGVSLRQSEAALTEEGRRLARMGR